MDRCFCLLFRSGRTTLRFRTGALTSVRNHASSSSTNAQSVSNCLLSSYHRPLSLHSRNTWVLRRVRPVPDSDIYDEEQQALMLYEVVRNEDETLEEGTVKVVLTRDVEEVGFKGDVIDVRRNFARSQLLLDGSAVYASPFNLQYYQDIIAARKRKALKQRPHFASVTMPMVKAIRQIAYPVYLSSDTPWTLQKWHLRAALRRQGVLANEHSVIMSPDTIEGPRTTYNNHLFRFYLVVNNSVVAPLICRLKQVSRTQLLDTLNVDRLILPEDTIFTEKEVLDADIPTEDTYVHEEETLLEDKKDVWALMQSRISR